MGRQGEYIYIYKLIGIGLLWMPKYVRHSIMGRKNEKDFDFDGQISARDIKMEDRFELSSM